MHSDRVCKFIEKSRRSQLLYLPVRIEARLKQCYLKQIPNVIRFKFQEPGHRYVQKHNFHRLHLTPEMSLYFYLVINMAVN